MCASGHTQDKARFCFELFDFNLNASLSRTELVMMMQSTVCGMLCLTGGGEASEPPLTYFEVSILVCIYMYISVQTSMHARTFASKCNVATLIYFEALISTTCAHIYILSTDKCARWKYRK
jgi:hypothetical protein